jgi:hypothetical protein
MPLQLGLSAVMVSLSATSSANTVWLRLADDRLRALAPMPKGIPLADRSSANSVSSSGINPGLRDS